jgi:response regulator RpfG family c-di-GMP phosphodiesterase
MPAESFRALMSEGRSLPRPAAALPEERTILLVDDEPSVLSALHRLLANEGYRVLTADGGVRGLELLAMHPVQVILADQRMPHMSGADFLCRAKDLHPETVRIVLSAHGDGESVTCAVNEGAIYKFLCKPWDDDDLRAQIRDAFLHHETLYRPRAARGGA